MVDFAVEKPELDGGSRVLDLGCGTGRHTLELARRGIRAAGLDYSEPSLAVAREASAAEGLDVELVHGDMRELPFADRSFDAVVNFFTAFGYFDDEADDERVLREVARVLRPGGRLLIDLLSPPGLFPRYADKLWARLPGDILFLQEHRYDAVSGRNEARWTLVHPDGRRSILEHSLRLYTLPELIVVMRRAGLDFAAAFGDFQGADYDRESRRMIVVASPSVPAETSSTARV